MKQCLDELFEQIIYYSTEYPDFAKNPKFNRRTRELADQIAKKCFKVIRKDRIVYINTFEALI